MGTICVGQKQFLCLILFLDTLGVGLVLPVMPELIAEIGEYTLEDAARWSGYLLLLYAGTQFLCAPMTGALSDRFGRRPILLLALLGFCVNYGLMAVAPTMALLLLARFVSGLCGATYPAAMAAMADLSDDGSRTSNFGLASAALGAGLVFGPALGGVLGEFNPRFPFIVAAVVTGLVLLYGYLRFPETLAKDHRRPVKLSEANPVGTFLNVLSVPLAAPILICIFCIQMASQSYVSVWSFFTIEIVNWTPFAIGFSAAIYGTMIVIVQGFLAGRAAKAIGVKRVITLGLGLGILAYLIAGSASTGWQIYLAAIVGAAAGLAYPALQSVLSSRVPSTQQGSLQGAVASAFSLSSIFGPLLMTQLFSLYADDHGLYLPGAPFFASALIIVIAMCVLATSTIPGAQPEGGVSKS